jgi:hypothetical protein
MLTESLLKGGKISLEINRGFKNTLRLEELDNYFSLVLIEID